MADLTKRNYAFISYNHHDVKWAKWLHQRLEWYRLPSEMQNELSDSRYIRPVFRDRDALTSGVLNDSLRNNLQVSKYLIVICSPHSAQSAWVSEEVQSFIDAGRLEYIIPFIIDGMPQDYSQADISTPQRDECFPLALRQWNKEHPDCNLLGIAVTDDGKVDREKAFVRLVAHLLGLEFDTLWHRHKRFLWKVFSFLAIFVVIALCLTYWFMIPVKATVTILDEKNHLPGMEQATLYVDGGEYSFTHPDTTISLNPLPGYYRLKELSLSIKANRFYNDFEGSFDVGFGISRHITVQLQRDSTFAIFAGGVFQEGYDDYERHPIEGAKVSLSGYETITDVNGHFRIVLPLDKQAEVHPIKIRKDGYQELVRDEEVPGEQLTYLLSPSK